MTIRSTLFASFFFVPCLALGFSAASVGCGAPGDSSDPIAN